MRGVDGVSAEALMDALAHVAVTLRSDEGWPACIDAATAEIADALDAVHGWIFRLCEQGDGRLRQRALSHWARPGFEPPDFAEAPDGDAEVDDPTLLEWSMRRRRGEIVAAATRDVAEPLRTRLARRGIAAILSVPILVAGRWWGHVTVGRADDRGWSAAERSFLGTATELVAAAINASESGAAAALASRAAIIDAAVDAIVTIDEADRVVEFNPTAERLFGIGAAEAIGQDLGTTLLPAAKRGEGGGAVDRAALSGRWTPLEITRADATPVPVEVAAAEIVEGDRRSFTLLIRDLSAERAAMARIEESEQRLRALVQDQTDCVVLWDADLHRTFVNRAYAQLMQRTPEDLVGHHITDGIALDIWARLKDDLAALTPENPVCRSADPKWTATGEQRWIEWSNRALFDEEGRRTGYLSVGRDVTEARRALEAVAENEERFRALVEHQTECVTLWDEKLTWTFVNRAYAALFNVAPEFLIGRHASETVLPEVWARLETELRTLTPEHPLQWSVDEKIIGNGEHRWFEWSNRALFNEGRFVGYLSVGRDVTERRQMAAELERLAFVDTATRLPNRNALLRWGAEHRPDTAIAIRIVSFDEIIASFGRKFGAALTAAVAARVQPVIAAEAELGRIGDDGLALLTSATEREATMIARRVLATLQPSFLIEGRRASVRASVGIARGALPAEDLLQDAESAATAKGSGAIRRFDAVDRMARVDRLVLDAELREALERRSEELGVFYQPIIDLAGRRIVGFEALARWHHPLRGDIEPSRFIAIAEASGLILQLGEYVLGQAVADAARWAGGGHEVYVSVNLSAQQCTETSFPLRVSGILAAAKLAPRHLRFELTETALMSEVGASTAVLRGLKGLGCGLAIDDFGIGYSSLGYLRQLPFDTLKIDKSFVAALGRSETDREIVRSMIHLAHALGLTVVAEGVETAAAAAELNALACDYGQGFLFGRPMRFEAAEAWRRQLSAGEAEADWLSGRVN